MMYFSNLLTGWEDDPTATLSRRKISLERSTGCFVSVCLSLWAAWLINRAYEAQANWSHHSIPSPIQLTDKKHCSYSTMVFGGSKLGLLIRRRLTHLGSNVHKLMGPHQSPGEILYVSSRELTDICLVPCSMWQCVSQITEKIVYLKNQMHNLMLNTNDLTRKDWSQEKMYLLGAIGTFFRRLV